MWLTSCSSSTLVSSTIYFYLIVCYLLPPIYTDYGFGPKQCVLSRDTRPDIGLTSNLQVCLTSCSSSLLQSARLKKMTFVRRQDCLVQRDQASKAPTSFSSNNSDNGGHKDLLKSNKLGPFQALAETLAGPLQTPLSALQDLSANRYS